MGHSYEGAKEDYICILQQLLRLQIKHDEEHGATVIQKETKAEWCALSTLPLFISSMCCWKTYNFFLAYLPTRLPSTKPIVAASAICMHVVNQSCSGVIENDECFLE